MTKQIDLLSGVCPEKREFKLHKDILWSIIQSQSGTLGKAVLELVMNSIDAGATSVDITISGKNISVKDDGKGFTNRSEIEQFFETFGTPHTKGDATYGRFRMGRGQIMAFSKNDWQSGEFAMQVDIKNCGLKYNLTTGNAPIIGCRINASLYEPLSPSEALSLHDDLRDLCKYAPIPIIINGQRISLDLPKQKWTTEDEDAYYLFRDGKSLEVYNLGVHVRSYYAGQFGVGGIVVSKKQLEVNFARNDILVNQCDVWKRIVKLVKAQAKKSQDKKPVQDENYREMMMSKILSGNFDSREDFVEAMRTQKVFTDLTNRNYTLEKMAGKVKSTQGALVIADELSFKADKVSQAKLAFVLHPKNLERSEYIQFSEVLDRIESHAQVFRKPDYPNPRFPEYIVTDYQIDLIINQAKSLKKAITSLDAVSKVINEQHLMVDEKDLRKEESFVLEVIRSRSASIAHAVGVDNRHIRVCSSETVDGYTDGSKLIFINRPFLKIGGKSGQAFTAFDAIKYLLLHEFMHHTGEDGSGDDSTSHGHTAAFYERYHDILSHHALNGWTARAVSDWFSLRRKAGATLRQSDKSSANLLFSESDSVNTELQAA